MIFVTVGTQLAFDRMLRVVDEWAGSAASAPDVFAQIGPSNIVPQHIEFERFIPPGQFQDCVREASVVVAHAGVGSIVTALRYGKPIVIVPRRASLGEQRNEHQLATAARFEGRPGICVAYDETELPRILDRLGDLRSGEPISPFGSPRLIAALQGFIDRCELK
jgi:UDP-N-acetylglucosamine transferase subunit ALG13